MTSLPPVEKCPVDSNQGRVLSVQIDNCSVIGDMIICQSRDYQVIKSLNPAEECNMESFKGGVPAPQV